MKKTKKLTCMLLIIAGLLSFVVFPAFAMNNILQYVASTITTTDTTAGNDVGNWNFDSVEEALQYYDYYYNCDDYYDYGNYEIGWNYNYAIPTVHSNGHNYDYYIIKPDGYRSYFGLSYLQ